ncbi:MAG: hypothetical protein O3A63_21525 [Proteobacteria bacterium]|nr:hypothetical protein [Pseudomonadota bacterium]
MWYLIEDFFDQSWVMKAAIGWGWLCVLIMISSMVSSVLALIVPAT